MQTQMPATPKLSVTVLNYNYGHYLPTCLDSILEQTFTDFEVILINDTSTDNSLEVIQPYLADPRVRLVDHIENKGFVRSLIEGCDLSRGEYITVISADDWSINPTAFEKQLTVMEQDREIAFIFTTYGHYEDEQHCTFIRRPASSSYVRSGYEAFKDLVLDRYPLHSGTIIRKTAYAAIGGYDPKLHYSVDAQIWLGLCHAGKVAYLDEMLYAYRFHHNNMSKNEAAVSRGILEVLQILDWSFGMFHPTERHKLGHLYKKAVRKTLVTPAIFYIFQGDYQIGWLYFWVAVQMRPAQTLLQKTVFILFCRTVLGKRGYYFLEQIKARFNSKTRARLAGEQLSAPELVDKAS